MTGTDLNKLKTCLYIVAGLFSQHCQGDSKFTIEQVEMIYEGEPELSQKTPVLPTNTFEIEVSYINTLLGLNLDSGKIAECANKMGL